MGLKFEIVYHESVAKFDISNIGRDDRKIIKEAIEKKLMAKPEVFGKPLRRSLSGYRKLRVGDHRVIFRIEKETVKIFCIAHRSIVYKRIDKRV